jgi:FKBP-type peptidyl-prolyl cis-trans isomerase FkpA
MSRTFRIAALAAAALIGLACRDVSAPTEDPATLAYAPSLNVNLGAMKRTTSGIYYQDLVVGTGKVAANDSTLKVYYTGSLASGHTFDTNVNKTPFSFTLGKGDVIKGWDEGIIAADPMRVGGRRRLIIPPALGYGNTTRSSIPAGSVLVFDVNLVQVGT